MAPKYFIGGLGHGAKDASELLECSRVFGLLVIRHDGGLSERSPLGVVYVAHFSLTLL